MSTPDQDLDIFMTTDIGGQGPRFIQNRTSIPDFQRTRTLIRREQENLKNAKLAEIADGLGAKDLVKFILEQNEKLTNGTPALCGYQVNAN